MPGNTSADRGLLLSTCRGRFWSRGCTCTGQAFPASHQHMAKLRPGGLCIVSYQHGNPFLWSSARGKTLLEQPAVQLSSSQLRRQGVAWLCRENNRTHPCALLRNMSSAASALGEARQLSQASLKHPSLGWFTLFSVLSFSFSAGISPLLTAFPGQGGYQGWGPGTWSCTSIKEFLRAASLSRDGKSPHLDRHKETTGGQTGPRGNKGLRTKQTWTRGVFL